MKRLVVPIVSLAFAWMFALSLPGDSASAVLPPPADPAVLAAIEGVVAAGAPSFVVHGVDEQGEWSAAAGVEDIKTGVPASPDAAFRIGSITKPMVAVAVLQLVGEGTLDLDEPVNTYVPGLLARGETVTLRHLLGHRSGMGATPYARGHYLSNGWVGGINQICNTNYDTVAQVRAADYSSTPGAFFYSNAGYQAIQLIIEKVTGESYQEVLTERIVEPLGLSGTSFQDGRADFPEPFLHGYTDLSPGKGRYKNGLLKDTTDCKAWFWTAAGSGISTARDVTTFFRALAVDDALDGGDLLRDELYDEMTDTQQTSFGFEYGLGIMRVHSCVELLGHTGAVFGYQSETWTTVDNVRTVTAALPVYGGSDAIWNAVGNMWSQVLCPPIGGESNRSTGTWHAPMAAHLE